MLETSQPHIDVMIISGKTSNSPVILSHPSPDRNTKDEDGTTEDKKRSEDYSDNRSI
jgi:hypothetical protein